MGKLLALSLFFTLVAAFFVVPAFLGPPPEQPDPNRPEGDEAMAGVKAPRPEPVSAK
jgi:hypothetical protein